ncbi:hypothetical protein ABPG72_020315 [Tetrahymena utriculariae]
MHVSRNFTALKSLSKIYLSQLESSSQIKYMLKPPTKMQDNKNFFASKVYSKGVVKLYEIGLQSFYQECQILKVLGEYTHLQKNTHQLKLFATTLLKLILSEGI